MTLMEIRNEFEYLKTGKVYFNHASVGPLPNRTVEAIKSYSEERSTGSINNFMHYLAIDKRAKRKLGNLIGCKPDRIAWSSSVGFSMSILAQGLNWEPGDRIILNNIEFPSNVYPFMNLQSKGVEIDFVDAKNGIVNLDDYEKLITPRTKLISISYVQFLSGYRTEIRRLSEICKSKGILLSVDVIQAAGNSLIEAEEWGVDFLTGGTQKWLCALEGLSYFYITEELQERLNQTMVGWGSVMDAWELLDYKLEYPKHAGRFQGGTPNSIGVFALNSSLDLFLKFGKEEIQKRVLDNSKYLISNLKELGFTPLLQNEEDEHLSAIVTFDAPNADDIKSKLAEKNIIVEVRVGKVRLSPHFYNTKEEIDLFLSELEKLKA